MTDLVLATTARVAALCSTDAVVAQNSAHALRCLVARNACALDATVTEDCAQSAIGLAEIIFGVD